MPDFSNSVLGVTGANGHLGRAVIGYLLARGAKHVVGITRDPSKIADLKGVEARSGDFDEAIGLDAAFKGIDRLLIISTDKMGEPGARLKQHMEAIHAAERAGVKHVLYTSIAAPNPDPKAAIANDHFWTEAALLGSKLDWTFLRNSLYMDLVLDSAERAIAGGQLVHASGKGRRSLVTRDDCAAAAAGALLTAEGKTIYDITGPEALSQAEIAGAIATASGKPVAELALPLEAFIEGMVAGGLPRQFAEVYAAFEAYTDRGYFTVTTGAVKALAGREPQNLASFLAAAQLAKAA
ncbi:MAG: NAD(P)H-binding protein [Devosia sp.]